MAHILKIMIEEKQISSSASIRKVETPLITPAISLDRLPYLTYKSLVLITTTCDEKTAEKITEEIPEVKAVIKGNTDETVGKLTENSQTNSYEVLSGCDIRCDIQYTDTEPIILYKKQSKIHIEYPKVESPKINQLKEVLEKYENPKVLDAMCGPGTLGIYAKLKNAKFVHFNDIYPESIDALKTNLKINQIPRESYEITNENLLELPDIRDTHFDIGIVDAFPNVETSGYVESLNKICDEIIII